MDKKNNKIGAREQNRPPNEPISFLKALFGTSRLQKQLAAEQRNDQVYLLLFVSLV